MIKNYLAFLVIALLFASCVNNQSNVENTTTELEVSYIALADFDAEAENYVGQKVTIEGIVDHVCKHGGKRMFIIDTASDGRVKITVGENIPSFDVELEGSAVEVTGTVDELIIDEEYLVQWESELQAEEQEAVEDEAEIEEGEVLDGDSHGEHSGQGEKADQGEHKDSYEMINEYRAQIAESEKGYLAFYSVICDEFKVKEE